MIYPDPNKPYKLFTDASDYAVGAVLTQQDDAGLDRPVHYISKTLTTLQRKWATIEKEAWAVVYSLQKLRPYLWGSSFTIYTDHKPLLCLFKQEIRNTRIMRWAVQIAEFQAPIRHIEGKRNVRADLLSRLQEAIAIIDVDERSSLPQQEQDSPNVDTHNEDGMNKGELRTQQIQEFPTEHEAAGDANDTEYIIEDGLVYLIRPPNNEVWPLPRLLLPSSYREEVMRNSHNAVGHQSVAKTMAKINERYYSPGMKKEVRQYIDLCPHCQGHNSYTNNQPMLNIPEANYPFQIVGMHMCGPFAPSSKSNARYLFTMIDHYSGYVEAVPEAQKTSEMSINALMQGVISRYSVPEILITDQGGEFQSREFRQLTQDLGIDHRRTTQYHPQTNGKIERFHRTLKSILSKLVNNNQTAWEDQLADALMAYRVAS